MSELKKALDATDHTLAPKNVQLEIVEYGDFQCPHCAHAEPFMARIRSQFGSAISFTFRNFPLTNIHQFAYAAAETAEAAGMQNKYWEMHDYIFEHQERLSLEFLINAAKHFDLDMDQFENDVKSEDVINKIDNDIEYGIRSGVNGTPSFFVNGKKFDGAAEDLYRLIATNAS